MTRSDLINRLHARFPSLTHDDAKAIVAAILESLANSLVHGERSEIRGFGSFETVLRKPRIGRNPRTGVKVAVPGKYAPHFKAGKELRERVDFR